MRVYGSRCSNTGANETFFRGLVSCNVAARYREAREMKEDIESEFSNVKDDGNLWLYYSLLDFRYKVLADGLQITKNSFDKIDKIDEIYKTSENRLSYYYYFF